MQVPIFSFVYIFSILYFVISSQNLKKFYIKMVTILVFLEISYLQGFLFCIGINEKTVLYFHQFLVGLCSILIIKRLKNNINMDIMRYILILVITPLCAMCIEVLFPYEGGILPSSLVAVERASWDDYVAGRCNLSFYDFSLISALKAYIKYLMFLVTLVAIKINLKIIDFYNIANKLIKISYFIVGYGYIECFFKNILGLAPLTYKFTEKLLGENHSSIFALNSMSINGDGWIRLQGLTREPSHYVLSLTFFALLILLTNKIVKVNGFQTQKDNHKKLFIATVFLMLLTGGASPFWGIFILSITYLMLNTNRNINWKRLCKWIMGVIIAIFSVFWLLYAFKDSEIYILQRFYRMLNTIDMLVTNTNVVALLGIGIDASTLARITSVLVCLGNWLDRPLFGLGLDSTTAHAFTATVLVQQGLIGTVALFKLLTVRLTKNVYYDKWYLIFIIFVAGLPYFTRIAYGMMVIYLLIAELTTIYYRRSIPVINKKRV